MKPAEPTAGEWTTDDGPGVYADMPDGRSVQVGTAEIDARVGLLISTACANARLFAASKDLLAACEETLALLRLSGSPTDPVQSSVEQLARAAIAKAKGEP